MKESTVNPLVSIIVRTKDRPKLLKRALRSIAEQTHRPIEVVLVNDGGCALDVEEIQGVLSDVRLNYIRLKENTGRAHAGNVGIENAKGEYLGFLDDDDSFYVDHLSTILGVLNNRDWKVAYSDAHIAYLDLCSQDGELKVKDRELFSSKDFSYAELLIDNYIPLICIVFSKEIFENIKGFDETLDLYEDWDMLVRIAEHYPFHHIGKVTAEYLQWSSELQIAQRPEFAEVAREAHMRIILKHMNKFKPYIILELVQSRRVLREREGMIENLRSERANLELKLSEQEKALNEIFSSHGWRFLLVYYGLRDRLLPVNSRIRKITKSLWRGGHSALAALQSLSVTNLKNYFTPVKEPVTEKSGDFFMADQVGNHSEGSCYRGTLTNAEEPKAERFRSLAVLVAGVYLANQENAIEHIVGQMKRSRYHTVTQRWVALFGDAPSEEIKAVTALAVGEAIPKFVLLNRLLSGEAPERYDYVVICDDDIWLPTDFLDEFLFLQEKYDFAVAQPARTHNSYIDHQFVEQLDGLTTRRTRFVEIGPLVSIRRDVFSVLFPFNESSSMGWGYDFVWPHVIEEMGLRMGIVDATPVDHSMREPMKNYDYDEANKSQEDYFSKNLHLSKDEAFRILESYA